MNTYQASTARREATRSHLIPQTPEREAAYWAGRANWEASHPLAERLAAKQLDEAWGDWLEATYDPDHEGI